jgi:hypothetical protein
MGAESIRIPRQPMRIQTVLSSILCVFFVVLGTQAHGLTIDRVDMAAALKQVVKKVDPVIPAEAARMFPLKNRPSVTRHRVARRSALTTLSNAGFGCR